MTEVFQDRTDIAGQWSTKIQEVHIEILITLQNTTKFHVVSRRNVCSHAVITRSFRQQLDQIVITFESWNKTCPNIEKKLVSISSPGGKKQ